MSLSKLETNILKFLQDNPDKSYKTDQLAQQFNFKGSKNYKRLIKALAFLERIGEIQVTDNGQFKSLNNAPQNVVGIFRSNNAGYGFIDYSEEEPDLFIPPGKTGNAMTGDTVEATVIKQVNPATGKGSEARIDRVIERSASQLVGEFISYDLSEREETGYLGHVIPQGDYNNAMRVMVLPEGITPVDHSIVIIKIKDYPTKEEPHRLTGYVAKEIGHKDEPGVDILAILYQFDIPHEFPENVIEEAEQVGQEIDPKDIEGRRDLRDQLIITIDGADAKDLDDAITLEKLDNGHYRLGVHIADVSHYVKDGSAMDNEAFERGTSVYLTDRVVPMLPQRLSNGICSLHPNVDRLTVSCEMTINEDGRVIEKDIFLSVINSSYRMTYTDVNAILAGDEELREEYHELVDMLDNMAELHHILEDMRIRRGALNFDTVEPKFIVDKNGHPLDIEVRERGVGERLIESFMLIANESIALTYREQDFPMIYRVHEQPDEERIQRFAEFVTAFGVVLRGSADSIEPKQLQETLRHFDETPYDDVVTTMMLRSMQQAQYSDLPKGHYGLAARDYTHFTSPIRRYPDLIVHRLIHLYLKGRPSAKTQNKVETDLPNIAEHSSRMERRSVDAERETESLKKAEYMLDKVGEQYEGVISSVTSFGIFVKLPNTVEGLISIQALDDDYYHFHQNQLVLIGERTNNIYRIGQKVLVEVERVSIEDREIDFKLIEAYPTDNKDLVHLEEQNKRHQRKRSRRKAKEQVDNTNRKYTKKKNRQFKIRKRNN